MALPVKAQSTGRLSGTVTDSVTGLPLIGALVAVRCDGCYGRHPTDSAGRYRIQRVPVGRIPFEVHCPSRTMLGSEIVRRDVTIADTGENTADVRVPPNYCDEPHYSERVGTFRGYWTPGFESSTFSPCADSALGVTAPLLPGKRFFPPRAWADWLPSARNQHVNLPEVAGADAWGNHTYFVVWHGVLKGPGTYGHMGVAEFGMVVDSVISISAARTGACKAP